MFSCHEIPVAVAPMPRFVLVAPRVAFGIREVEIEVESALGEPGEGRSRLEHGFEGQSAGGRDIDGAPAVVFTESWWRADRKNFINVQACVELALDNSNLTLDAAKGRDDKQLDAIALGGRLHGFPGSACGGDEQVRTSIQPCFGYFEELRFFIFGQSPGGERFGGNPQCLTSSG